MVFSFSGTAILGLHSMISQEQYHASIQNKGQTDGTTFESLVKASMPKPVPLLPDNATDTSKTAQKVLGEALRLKRALRRDFPLEFDLCLIERFVNQIKLLSFIGLQ